MKVTLDEIKAKFDILISGSNTRETVSDWALIRKSAQDNKALEYYPKEKEKLIWEGIMYFIGVDIKDSPSTYIHR